MAHCSRDLNTLVRVLSEIAVCSLEVWNLTTCGIGRCHQKHLSGSPLLWNDSEFCRWRTWPHQNHSKTCTRAELHSTNWTDTVLLCRNSPQRFRKLINAITFEEPIWKLRGPMDKRLWKQMETARHCLCAAGHFSSFHSLLKELRANYTTPN